MNSMLRQHHIRLQDLEGYLRGYDPTKPVPQDEWAKTESADFEPGMLVFCLDAVAAPPGGLASFGKKDSEVGETFRVKDLCIVVGKENARPLVVSITASAYELRFLEALMLEKARKAILDARQFYYVTAKPSKPLTEAMLKEVEQLGNVYAQGGSRRSLTVESSGPMEPAVALLAALGVRLSVPGGKQVLDIGSICHMLFASNEGRQQEDKNRTLIKSCFTPLSGGTLAAGRTGSASAVQGKASQPVASESPHSFEPSDTSEAKAEGKEGRVEGHADEGFDYSVFGQLTEPPPERVSDHLQMPKPALTPDKPESQAKPDTAKKKDAAHGQALFEAFTPQESQGSAEEAKGAGASGSYKHLAEALSGLVEAEPASERPGKAGELSQVQPEGDKGRKLSRAKEKSSSESEAAGSPQVRQAPAQPVPASKPEPASKFEPPPKPEPASKFEAASKPEPAAKPETEKLTGLTAGSSKASDRSSSAVITGDHEPIVTPPPPKVSASAQSSKEETTTGDNIPASPTRKEVTESPMSTTPTAFQEPQAVMNEMASLMSKLEQQVSKASKKLASRAEEIEHRLNRRTETLLDEASQDDKNTEASILVLCDSLTKQFEQLSEELRLKVSDAAAVGRESIKSLQGAGHTQIDDTRTDRQESLLKASKDFRSHTEALAESSEEHFEKIAREHMEQAQSQVKTILEHLKDIADDFENRLNQRFKRFTERMAEESGAVINSIQRNVHSMEEEIDGSWERASEKLKSSQADFEQTIEHTLAATELSIAQAARILLVEQFLPKLKERKEIVLGMSAEMMTAFTEQSHSQTRSQLTGLDTSLASARQQLQTLAEECLGRIDSVGRQQQAGLEDLFKDTSGFMERSTADVLTLVDKTEQQIHDVEGVCKKLAETSSLDADPHLTDERNNAVTKVQNLKGRLKSELDRTLETHCSQLEQLGQTVQSQLNTRRIEQTQTIREASESGLNRIKEAIQEAFNAVQTAREKYME